VSGQEGTGRAVENFTCHNFVRTGLMANTLTSLTTVVALIAGSSVAALGSGTEAQREACTPDAFRLCTSAMPDEGRVENCLRSAGPRLSRACYDVFFPQIEHDQAQMMRGQAPSRERMKPSAADRMQTPSMPQMPPAGGDDD
jgi:hypothetical protein